MGIFCWGKSGGFPNLFNISVRVLSELSPTCYEKSPVFRGFVKLLVAEAGTEIVLEPL